MKTYTGKEERINGIWYSVQVEAESLKEANTKLYKGQRKSYGIVEEVRGRWFIDDFDSFERRKKYYEQQRALREEAKDFQREMHESSPSWWEIADYQSDLERRARKYGLIREFRENGII